jgi:hypothetical protein
MWLRRAFFGWLVPAAFLLPLWLLVGWGVFDAGGWAFLWVLFLAIPSVFIVQLILTMIVRARASVRVDRAVSWFDVLGFTVWHGLIIALGFYDSSWWALAMVTAIFVAIGLFWLTLWQLWREARVSSVVLHTTEGIAYVPPPEPRQTAAADPDVIVITEKPKPEQH